MSRPALLYWVYIALAIVGTVLSWLYFVEHFQAADSILIGPFLKAATATPASTGVALDAYFSGIVFSIMALTTAKKEKVQWPWAYIALCFLVGLCLALPLFLAMRERALISAADSTTG